MFIDASALTAMIVGEEDAADLLQKLQGGGIATTSPVAVWETGVAVARRLAIPVSQAGIEVFDFMAEVEIKITAIEPAIANLALDAFDRFGKGRHAARLNMGDCFAYACARHYRQPLLYKGDDFALTDIGSA